MNDLQIIGTGSLGEAIATGLLQSSNLKPNQLTLIHRDPTRARRIANRFPGVTLATALQSDMDAIVSVRPDQVESVLIELGEKGPSRVVSVAAGIPLDALQKGLGNARIFRSMPNIAVKYRLGQTAIACPPETTAADLEWVQHLYGLLGDAIVIDESMFDAFTAIYGCAPGFLMKFLSAMTDAAVDLGFEKAEAQRLLISSLQGNAQWLSEHVETMHDELRLMTRLGGPTSLLASTLDANQFDETIRKAAAAATERSREMGA